MADEFEPDGMSEFIFGAPGELTVDASHGKSAFPVPENTLVFPTKDHFIEFMVGTFNARVEFDEAGNPFPLVSVTTIGIPYVSDANGELVEVNSPLSTFLGGPDGYYFVGGEPVCVDPDKCNFECLPPPTSSSMVVQMSASPSFLPPMSTSASSLGLAPMQTMQSMAAGSTFSVVALDGGLETITPARPQRPYLLAGVETRQWTGPLPFKVILCGPPQLVQLPNGMIVQRAGTCSTQIANPNELSLEVEYQSDYSFYTCDLHRMGPPLKVVMKNVPRILYQRGFSLYQPGHLSGYKLHSEGADSRGVKSTNDLCFGTGCFKRDPCK